MSCGRRRKRGSTQTGMFREKISTTQHVVFIRVYNKCDAIFINRVHAPDLTQLSCSEKDMNDKIKRGLI